MSWKSDWKFSTWIYSITYNYCIDYIRRTKKKKDLFSDEIEKVPDVVDEIPDKELLEMEVMQLKKVLEVLPPDDTAILMMKYQDGMSIKEIGKVIGKTESAIKMRIKRAKENYRKQYPHYGSCEKEYVEVTKTQAFKEGIYEKRDKDGMNRTEHKLYVTMKGLGLDPQPQYKISNMTVDFAFPDKMLVIEVNGPSHDTFEQKERDRNRWFVLNNLGWSRKSFRAKSVNKCPVFIAEKIKEHLETL